MDEKVLYKLNTLQSAIRCLADEMDLLYSRMIYKPLKYGSDRVITSVPNSGLEEDFAKIDTVRAKLQKKQTEYMKLYEEALGAIFKINDPREQVLLLGKYIQGMDEAALCRELKCSPTTLYRVQQTAVQHFREV